MNINATLLGQAVAFTLFVIFCMKYVWPPIVKALQSRQKQIADGLEAASRAEKDLELARRRSADTMREAKDHAADLIAQANKRAASIIDEAKEQANLERTRILDSAKSEIEQETNRAREHLRDTVAALAVDGAGRILQREIDKSAHADLLDELARQL